MRSLTTEPNIHDYDSKIKKDSRLTSLQTVMFLFKLYTYNRFIALKNTSLKKDKNEYPHKYASRNSLRLLDRLHMMLYLNKKQNMNIPSESTRRTHWVEITDIGWRRLETRTQHFLPCWAKTRSKKN